MPLPICKPLRLAFPIALLTLPIIAPAAHAQATKSPDSAAIPASGAALPTPVPPPPPAFAAPVQSYADMVDLSAASQVVARATVRRQTRLKPEQAPGVAPGFARLYIEADTSALLVGPEIGESLRFLADVPLDAKGKVPRLIKSQVLLFGTTVPDRPGELQLMGTDTMFPWSAELEARVRTILTALLAPDAPPKITGVREALHVPGNLLGEGETQFFLSTDSGKPVSISVLRRPGEPPRWGVSFSEIVDQSATPPAPETLAWYRLACALPRSLPERAGISATAADNRLAAQDYQTVLDGLGPCTRNRTVRLMPVPGR